MENGKRKVILIGSSTCGKTTLCQRLNGLTIKYHKTQTIGLMNNMIDTPGEEDRIDLRSSELMGGNVLFHNIQSDLLPEG